MTAKGKAVTAHLKAGDRIIVSPTKTPDVLGVSVRKTGPDALRATVQSVSASMVRQGGWKAQRRYRIVTDIGVVVNSAPSQTYWTWQ